MKHFLISVINCIMVLMLFSCDKNIENEPESTCITAEATNITETTVVLHGYANLTSDVTGPITMGFLISEDEVPSINNSTRITTKELKADHSFQNTVSNLSPNTEYYYCAYVYRNSIYIYGEIRSFTTSDFSVTVTTLNASDIYYHSATLSGSFSTNSKDDLSATGGFLLGKDASIDVLRSLGKNIKGLIQDNTIMASAVDLDSSSEYYFVAYIDILGSVYYGGLSSFKTETPTLTVSPMSLSFTSNDTSTKSVTVTTTEPWSASTSDDWIHLDKTSGNSDTSVKVTVDVNSETQERQGVISFSGAQNADITVIQTGAILLVSEPDEFDGTKRSLTTYQLLIYSFADSDGDGIGDFKGIQNKLDYLDDLGVTAIWLSPVHPASSYHAYDVNDYYSVNPLYGTEDDFKALIDAAHAKGIKIYLDYVLNHSGKDNAWFKEAVANPSSPYRNYYFFSSNPSADFKSFPMLWGTTYQAGEWRSLTSGSPKLTIKKTNEAIKTGSSDWNLWLWKNGADGKALRFVDKGDGTYYLVTEISGSVGMLVRKYMNWNTGSKFGAKSGEGKISEDKAIDLVPDGCDLNFTGSGRYRIEIANVSTETLYYMGSFSDWMPDLNYGDISNVENNACFKDISASADKWIKLGIDGFRLDAVKHICGGIDSYNKSSNITFLTKWYEHCNAAYKAAGHSNNIFMVAEEWDDHDTEKQYYKALTSCFEFDYFNLLVKAVGGTPSSYVSTVSRFISDHKAQRSDAVTSLFMSNHDQNRAAESLGKDIVKEKQAAAMMLTTPGKPFIYQGEELGYYGKKDNGDEYVRTPMMWDKAGKDCAKKGVENKVDNAMLTSSISVEAQSADKESLLSVYRAFSRVRNTYPAMAEGTMTASTLNDGPIASWYMTASDGNKMLVIHNCGNTEKKLEMSDDISKPVAILGTVKSDNGALVMPAHSSIVFLL